MSRIVGVVASLLGCVLAGCPARGPEVERPPGFPTDFTPPPALGSPPEPDPEAPGLAYLRAVEPALAGPFGAFLEDCRLRLPPGHALNDAALVALVELTLEGDGQLGAVALARSSGNPEFDGVVLDIARDAALPPPPAEVQSDDGRAYLSWGFARDLRQAGVAGASVRRTIYPLDRAVPELIAAGKLATAAQRIAEAAEQGPAAGHAGHLRAVALAAAGPGLTASDPAVARAAVRVVVAGKLGELSSALVALAGGGLDPVVRQDAIRGLGLLGDPTAAAALLALVGGDQRGGAEFAAAAAVALDRLGQRGALGKALRASLSGSDEDARWAALAALSRVAVPELVPALLERASRGDKAERQAALAALGPAAATTASAAAALVAGLGAADPALRAAAAQALAEAAGRGLVSRVAYRRLIERLTDQDERVRAAAVAAAARLDRRTFGRDLVGLASEKSALVELALADALAAVPGPAALARLDKLLAAPNPVVRTAAERALCSRTEPELTARCAALIASNDLSVRLAAVAAQDEAGLRGLLADGLGEIRAAALARLLPLAGERQVALAARGFADASEPAAGLLVLAAWLEVAGAAPPR